MPAPRGAQLWGAAARGALLGLAGVGVMTLGEKAEQSVTHRPDSYVPARTLLALLGRRPPQSAQPLVWNHVMHYGTGAVLGALRGVWSVVGLRGPRASLAHAVVRLATDQTLENTTGVGAPPHTWPRSEHAVDVAHKAVYAMATGLLTDALIAPTLESRGARTSR